MNYIINPSVFYWINVMSIVQTVFAVLGSFMIVGCFVFLILYFYYTNGLLKPDKPEEENRYETERYKREIKSYLEDVAISDRFRKWAVITCCIGSILIIVAIFIPGKQTSVEMLVAKTTTFDNVNWTVSQVKEIIDYIVNAIKGVV